MNDTMVWGGVLMMIGGPFFALRGDLPGWVATGILVIAGIVLTVIGVKR